MGSFEKRCPGGKLGSTWQIGIIGLLMFLKLSASIVDSLVSSQ